MFIYLFFIDNISSIILKHNNRSADFHQGGFDKVPQYFFDCIKLEYKFKALAQG